MDHEPCYLRLNDNTVSASCYLLLGLWSDMDYGNIHVSSVLCSIFPQYVSSFLLCIVSTDRCLLIAFPVWSQNHCDEMQASLICAAIWIFAILNPLPYYLF